MILNLCCRFENEIVTVRPSLCYVKKVKTKPCARYVLYLPIPSDLGVLRFKLNQTLLSDRGLPPPEDESWEVTVEDLVTEFPVYLFPFELSTAYLSSIQHLHTLPRVYRVGRGSWAHPA